MDSVTHTTREEILSGVRVLVREGTQDLQIANDNLVKRQYEKFFPILPGERWLDIGGQIGTFALRVLQAGGHVYSAEPDPAHCLLYRENLTRNRFGFQITDAAILQKPAGEEIDLLINNYKGHYGGNSVFNKWKRSRPVIRVPCVSFPEFSSKAKKAMGPGEFCLKLDCEGAEIEILENLDGSFRKVVVEYHFSVDPSLPRVRAIRKRLEKLGYRIQGDSVPKTGDVWTRYLHPNILMFLTME